MKKIIACMLCCLMLVGCSNTAAETTGPVKEPVMTAAPAETAPPETTGIQEHFITLYAPNEDATGFIYASWEVPEISAETICDALIEAGVLNNNVAFNSLLLLENGQLTLDVNDAFVAQLMSYGTAGEYMMVGSVVNTLLSAYSAESIIITMEGEIMESGHVIYDMPMAFYE